MKEIEISVPAPVASFGVQDTIEILKFGFDLQEAIFAAFEDGKITLWDLPLVLKPFASINAAVDGFANVKKELLDLDDMEKQTLYAFVRERFSLPNVEIEQLIEQTIDEVLGDIEVATKWAARRKNKA